MFNLSMKIFFISEAIFFVGERNVEIYSAPTIPKARPISSYGTILNKIKCFIKSFKWHKYTLFVICYRMKPDTC